MPPQSFSDYEIPESDLNKIKSLCGFPEHFQQHEIPTAIARKYYDDRVRADRLSLNLDDRDIWNIVCRAAMKSNVKMPEVQNYTVLELFRKKKIKAGDYLFCKWQNKDDVPAVLIGSAGKSLVIRLVGDSEERRIADSKVRLAPDDWEPPRTK